MSTRCFFHRGKVARAWSSPLRFRMITGRPPVSHISLWYAKGQLYMPSPVVGNENGNFTASDYWGMSVVKMKVFNILFHVSAKSNYLKLLNFPHLYWYNSCSISRSGWHQRHSVYTCMSHLKPWWSVSTIPHTHHMIVATSDQSRAIAGMELATIYKWWVR